MKSCRLRKQILFLITIVMLVMLLSACDGEPTGFTPGSESWGIGWTDSERPVEHRPNPWPDDNAPTDGAAIQGNRTTQGLPDHADLRPSTDSAQLSGGRMGGSPRPISDPVPLSLALAADQTHTNAPSATWTAGDSSRISRYEVALGISMGGNELFGWKDVGLATNYRIGVGPEGLHITLAPNRDYYFSVRAVGADGAVLGTANSQAWFIYQPYTFDVNRYPSVTQAAPDSFWGIRHPDPRYATWDESFEAYVSGSAAIDLHRSLGGKVLTGSSLVKILQSESDFPRREGVTRLGMGVSDSDHADTVASMLYDCEVAQRRQSYYKGCQINPRKYAMTSGELGERLNDFVLTAQNVDAFERSIFGEMRAPHVWSITHAHPTFVQRSGAYEQDQVTSLRLGDWMFARYNILAFSPQPGSSNGYENSMLSGNYYNAIVTGKKSYNTTYPAQSSIDNAIGPRYKPDIVVAASNQAEASSWSVPTLAAAGSAFLGLANTDRLLSGAAYMQTMKAILLAGAGKDHLCPASITETEGYCNGLPSTAEQWQWSNSESTPLDPTYGVGLFNYQNSFEILTAGRSPGGVRAKDVGWDSQELASGQQAAYTFTVSQANDAFSLVLTWNRDISVDAAGNLTSHLADFMVELRGSSNGLVWRSDDPGNNIEHIYVPGGLIVGQTYTITVTLKSSDMPVRYGLAWQVRNSGLENELWREE